MIDPWVYPLVNATADVNRFIDAGHMPWLLGLCMAADAIARRLARLAHRSEIGARLIRPSLVTISLGMAARRL